MNGQRKNNVQIYLNNQNCFKVRVQYFKLFQTLFSNISIMNICPDFTWLWVEHAYC